MVRKPSRVVRLMLPRQAAVLACILLVSSTTVLGIRTDDRKCKCFMCICDFDPHPLPPELPPHHDHPPPTEPEHHSPPPESEHVPSPPPPEPEHVPPPALPESEHHYPPPVVEPVPEYHYYPPPAYGYYPSVGLPYYPPAGEMYPRDKAASKSGAHRQRAPSRLLLVATFLVLSSCSLLMRPS
jgi:hypothetical protein